MRFKMNQLEALCTKLCGRKERVSQFLRQSGIACRHRVIAVWPAQDVPNEREDGVRVIDPERVAVSNSVVLHVQVEAATATAPGSQLHVNRDRNRQTSFGTQTTMVKQTGLVLFGCAGHCCTARCIARCIAGNGTIDLRLGDCWEGMQSLRWPLRGLSNNS